ncbi:MAG TPA: MarR family transcriptional regulator, partial [Anaerolineae bacterium]|nr:MarR family transcriptional regulator [Anaerolineae bacterium]
MARRNRAAALDLIRRHGGMSRSQLAQRLELSAAAMTKIANELMDQGLIAQEPVLDLSPSQPRAMLRLNADWGYVVTLSLTYNLAVGVVDFAGKLTHSERLAGNDCDHGLYRDRFDDLVLDAVSRMLDRLGGQRTLGVGVLSYGCVDKSGLIRFNGSLPRPNVRMSDVLAPVTRLPVSVDEEFRLLLMAHLWSSDHPAQNVVVMSAKMFGAGGGQAMLASG